MDLHALKAVHLTGVGGINMSAVAKLLLSRGVKVSGSDAAENEQLSILRERGAYIKLGHARENVPADAELLVYSSAVPENNPEREEARRRGIPEMTNFKFLGELYKDKKTLAVVGTHGKSTTTAMLGLALTEAGLDPTVVVGSKVPGFIDGNLRLGSTDLFVVEGDEYARHFLEFHPHAVLLNNLELDHTDIYPTLEDVMQAFAQLLRQVKPGGLVIANTDDANVAELLKREAENLRERGVRVSEFGAQAEWAWSFRAMGAGAELELDHGNSHYRFALKVAGAHNAANAAGAALLALQTGADYLAVAQALAKFNGIWRRFESLGERNGAHWFSDYAHHPTAVALTLKAAHESFPSSRVVLCYQPHHKKRTRSLFDEFIPSFDGADVLVMCEIYDVVGREQAEDADISSRHLVAAIQARDEATGRTRDIRYAADPEHAVEETLAVAQPGDVVIIMGAGDIDSAARKLFQPVAVNA